MKSRAKFLLSIGLLGILSLWVPSALRADSTTYTYTGNTLQQDTTGCSGPCSFPYNGTTDAVTGSFTLSTALGDSTALTNITNDVTSFSFSDGLQTITNNTTGVSDAFFVATNASGGISAWGISLSLPSGDFIVTCDGDTTNNKMIDPCSPGNGWGVGGAADETGYTGGIGLIESDAGTWSVPEPSSLLLTVMGLAALTVAMRRKRVPQEA
jgi:hypothetical protein